MHKIKAYQYEYSISLPISLHDCDAMGIVWHGNYLKFFEIAREGLFSEHNLDYHQLEDTGYIYPVIEEQIRYRKAVSVHTKSIRVRAYLLELYNRIKLGYEVFDDHEELCSFGYTVQVAVTPKTFELCLITPPCFSDNFTDFKEV